MRLSCTGLQACAGTPSRAESGGRKTVPRRLWDFRASKWLIRGTAPVPTRASRTPTQWRTFPRAEAAETRPHAVCAGASGANPNARVSRYEARQAILSV